MKIVFATGNEHKMEEIRAILAALLPSDTELYSMAQAGSLAMPEETGTTFAENALIKAQAVANQLHAKKEWKDAYVWADDSGLCIDYLHGEPGIYSARFMGHDTPYDVKNAALVERLASAQDAERTARFSCSVAVVQPDGSSFTVTEHLEGEIAKTPAGCGGFGYDPIFYLPAYGCTSAELPPGGKNKISHRGKALRAAAQKLMEK